MRYTTNNFSIRKTWSDLVLILIFQDFRLNPWFHLLYFTVNSNILDVGQRKGREQTRQLRGDELFDCKIPSTREFRRRMKRGGGIVMVLANED